MANTEQDGGPAFSTLGGAAGMTLRDYFAAKAMQGELSAQGGEDCMDYDHKNVGSLASWSYMVADAMLARRQKEKP